MKIYIFKSDANSDLRAFAGDVKGIKLPEQFRPWHAIGVIADDRDPPHRLPRAEIERAIDPSWLSALAQEAAGKGRLTAAGLSTLAMTPMA